MWGPWRRGPHMSVATVSVEDMTHPVALAGLAGVAGGIAAATAGYRATHPISDWANRVRAADVQLLEVGQVLPPMPEPEDSPVRHRRKRVRIYLTSILGAALAVALIGALTSGMIIHGMSRMAEMIPGERIIGFLVGAAVGGIIGFLVGAVLGALIGGVLDFREIRARISAEQTNLTHLVWKRREDLRAALAARRLTPQAAIQQLRDDMGA